MDKQDVQELELMKVAAVFLCTVATVTTLALTENAYRHRYFQEVLEGRVHDESFVVISYKDGGFGITQFVPQPTPAAPNPLVHDYCRTGIGSVTTISALDASKTRSRKPSETCETLQAEWPARPPWPRLDESGLCPEVAS